MKSIKRERKEKQERKNPTKNENHENQQRIATKKRRIMIMMKN